jgi:hypothetical protein
VPDFRNKKSADHQIRARPPPGGILSKLQHDVPDLPESGTPDRFSWIQLIRMKI